MRRKLIIGNWKMHGSRASIDELLLSVQSLVGAASSLAGVDTVVCPPSVFIPQVAAVLSVGSIACGAQTISEYEHGAYTGEISGSMLAEFDCRYAIVGHSERRSLFVESDAQLVEKFVAAQRAGITPIYCVGESLPQREAGTALGAVSAQLQVLIDRVGIEAFAGTVIAYEPVWAIGTGKTATPEQVRQVHGHIRALFARVSVSVAAGLQIVYGGSVNAVNAAELLGSEDIDGALVGGASLKAQEFAAIITAARSAYKSVETINSLKR